MAQLLLDKPTGWPRQKVEELAEDLAKVISYQPGGDIYGAIDTLGGKIEIDNEPFAQKESQEAIHIAGKKNFVIRLPAATSIARDRFTIAHELGHYVLHYLIPLKNEEIDSNEEYYARRFGSDPLEWEANWFAAAFLMPKEAYIEAFRRNEGLHSLIASEFGVSARASEVRADNLKITI